MAAGPRHILWCALHGLRRDRHWHGRRHFQILVGYASPQALVKISRACSRERHQACPLSGPRLAAIVKAVQFRAWIHHGDTSIVRQALEGRFYLLCCRVVIVLYNFRLVSRGRAPEMRVRPPIQEVGLFPFRKKNLPFILSLLILPVLPSCGATAAWSYTRRG